jgi:hypothetical protein
MVKEKYIYKIQQIANIKEHKFYVKSKLSTLKAKIKLNYFSKPTRTSH